MRRAIFFIETIRKMKTRVKARKIKSILREHNHKNECSVSMQEDEEVCSKKGSQVMRF